MKERLKQKLFESLADVFEVLFVISSRPLDDFPAGSLCNVGGSYLEVRIDISREDRFPTYFFFPEELAQELSRNFMGLAVAGSSDEQVETVVREAVRMMIGGLLGKIDPEANCTIGTPTARRFKGFSCDHLRGAYGACVYETEFGPLWMDLGNFDKCC